MAAVEISVEGDQFQDIADDLEDVPQQYQQLVFNEIASRWDTMIGEIEDSAPELEDNIQSNITMQGGVMTMTMSFTMPGVAVAQQVFGAELSVPSSPEIKPVWVGKESSLPMAQGLIKFSNDNPLYQPIMAALSRFFAGLENEMGMEKEEVE
jgi:hypothetical protein